MVTPESFCNFLLRRYHMLTLKDFCHMAVDGFTRIVVELDSIEFIASCHEIVRIPEFAQLRVHGWVFDRCHELVRVYVHRCE